MTGAAEANYTLNISSTPCVVRKGAALRLLPEVTSVRWWKPLRGRSHAQSPLWIFARRRLNTNRVYCICPRFRRLKGTVGQMCDLRYTVDPKIDPQPVRGGNCCHNRINQTELGSSHSYQGLSLKRTAPESTPKMQDLSTSSPIMLLRSCRYHYQKHMLEEACVVLLHLSLGEVWKSHSPLLLTSPR